MADIPNTDNIQVAVVAAALRLAGEMGVKMSPSYWSGVDVDDEQRREKVLKNFEDAYKAIAKTIKET